MTYDPDVQSMEQEFNERLKDKNKYIGYLEDALIDATQMLDNQIKAVKSEKYGAYIEKNSVAAILESVRTAF